MEILKGFEFQLQRFGIGSSPTLLDLTDVSYAVAYGNGNFLGLINNSVVGYETIEALNSAGATHLGRLEDNGSVLTVVVENVTTSWGDDNCTLKSGNSAGITVYKAGDSTNAAFKLAQNSTAIIHEFDTPKYTLTSVAGEVDVTAGSADITASETTVIKSGGAACGTLSASGRGIFGTTATDTKLINGIFTSNVDSNVTQLSHHENNANP